MVKSNFKNRLLIAIASLCSAISYGQSNYRESLSNLTPKNPDASAFEKFITIPPGNYTGTSSVNVPIYTIECGGQSFPISLDYHVSGVRVGDIASRVGIGWSMNIANISLNKQTIGYNDVGAVQDYTVDATFAPDYLSGWGGKDFNIAQKATGILCGIIEETHKKDTQPDIYSYSIGSMSGKFFRDSDYKIQKIPYTSAKISIGSPFSYNITDEDGNLFIFKPNGNQRTISGSGSQSDQNAFMIEKIILNTGEQITFSYTKVLTYKYIIGVHESMGIYNYNESCSETKIIEKPMSLSTTKEFILTEINFPNGKVIFKYSDDSNPVEMRKDLHNDVFLKSVKIINSSGAPIKNYLLNHSYIESEGYSYTNQSSSYPHLEDMRKALYYRLKLDKVEETLSQTNYRFEYNNTHQLPYRLSPDTDYWGYYNGAGNFSGLPLTMYNNRMYGDANKELNFNYGITGSMKKVYFPTGGSKEFEYENDDYYFEGIEENYEKMEFEIDTHLDAEFNTNYPFFLNGDIDHKISFFSDPNSLENCTDCLPLSDSSYIYGQILNQNLQQVAVLYQNKEIDVVLPANQLYYLRIKRVKGGNFHGKLKFSWYKNLSVPVAHNKKIGSFRVKSIVLKNNITPSIRRNYFYLKTKNSLISSGINHGDKTKSIIIATSPGTYYPTDPMAWDTGSCVQVLLSRDSGINLSSANGKSVGYDFVREEYVDLDLSSNSYSNEFHYSNELDDDITDIQTTPRIPRGDKSFLRGQILSEKKFNSDSKIVHSTSTIYESDNYFNLNSSMQPSASSIAKAYAIDLIRIKWSKLTINGLLHHETPWGRFFYGFKWRDYQIPSTWLRVKETRTSDYFDNDSITSLKSYYYSPDYKHIMPVRTTVTSSTGDITESLYKYAPDFVGNTMMTKLTNQNQISTPIETIINFKGNKVFEEKIIYNEDANTDYKVMPIAVYAAKFPNNLPVIPVIGQLEKKISFNRYKSGKILEYAVADGPPTTLLWGYNNQKMIAKIENANYSLFHSQYTNLQTTSNDTISTVAFNAALTTLRNSVPQSAMITTYTHLPLFGVSSIVDPKNEKHTFFYDSAARLRIVRDNQNKILSENFYKYF